MLFSAVLYDFDGTIVDTETPIFEVWRELYRERGQVLELDVWALTLGTHGAFDPVEHLEGLTGEAVDRESLIEEMRRRARPRCAEEPLRPGIAEILVEARELGLKTAVASSSESAWIDRWIRHHAIAGAFDRVVSREHVERYKPEPDVFLKAAAELDVAPERCLVIEDTPNGVLAARRAGMFCVAVPNALTRRLEFPPADLTVPSLAGRTLASLMRQLPLRQVTDSRGT